MRYIVTLIAILVSFGITIAQTGSIDPKDVPANNHQTEIEKLQQQVENAEIAFQSYFDSKKPRELVIDSLKTKHENVTNALDSIIKIQQEQLAEYQEEISVYRFFSNTEETIFADTTLKHNGWDKKLSGPFQTQYNTISSIREVSMAISEVEETIKDMSEHQQEKGWNDEQLRMAIALEIGNVMNTSIANQLNDIAKMDLSFLSPKQQEYYSKLTVRYNKIFIDYF